MSKAAGFSATSAYFFLLGLLIWLSWAAAAAAADIDGAWASNSSACRNVFFKSKRGVSFTRNSEAFGSGFIIEGDRIKGKLLACRILRRHQDADTIHLLASCSSHVMLDTVQFSLRATGDNQIVRLFPGIPELEFKYERCRF